MLRPALNVFRPMALVGLLLAASIASARADSAPPPDRIRQLKLLQVTKLRSEALERQTERELLASRARHREIQRHARQQGRHAIQRVRRRERREAQDARRVGESARPSPLGTPDEPRISAAARMEAARRLSAGAPGATSFARNVHANDPSLDDPTQGDTQSEPAIGAFGNDVLVCWNEGRAAHDNSVQYLGYGYSTDGGQTFTPGGSPPQPIPLGGVWTSDPVVQINEKTGDFYFCGLIAPVTSTGEDANGVAVVKGTFAGSSFAFGTTHVAKSIPDANGFIDKPWMAVDSLSGNVYVTYTRFAGGADSIIFTRSTDGGVTWGPQLALSPPSPYSLVQGSRPVVGPDGEVYVIWKEIGLNDPNGQDSLLIRKSTNFGVSFGPAVSAARLYDNFGTGAPGFNREQGIALPSIGVDRTNGSRRGSLYVAWNESVNYWDTPAFDTTRGTPVNEVESNDTTTTAQPFAIGAVISGTFTPDVPSGRPADFDYYKFNATQGSTYVFYCDRINVRYTLRIIAADGTRLAFSGDRNNVPPAPGLIVWTCPRTADYYLRLVNYINGELGSYRVRTAFDPPGGVFQRARDQRDAFVVSSQDGLTWGTATRVDQDDPWYDDWLPEVAVAGDGTVYTLWFDWRDAPTSTCGGVSQTYMSRSTDGGASWLELGAASDAFSNWTLANANLIPNQGDYTYLFANGTGVYPCWTDCRVGSGSFGTPDIYTAPFPLAALVITVQSVAVDTSRVAITWQVHGPPPATVSVYRAQNGGAYGILASNQVFDGSGQLAFVDSTIAKGTQYRYAVAPTGSDLRMGERTVFVPGVSVPSLALAMAANPARGSIDLSLTLPTTGRATIALYDISGRERDKVTVSGVTQVPHLTLGAHADLEAGMYLVRLTQGGRDITKRVTFLP